eukprot:10955194-Lingulodinium_polyedra.AAC.1
MRSATHSTAAAPHMFAKRALHANTENGDCMERAFCENVLRRSGRIRCGTHSNRIRSRIAARVRT